MKIKVVSLSSSIRRRDNIRKQFRELGAPFEFSDAITAEDALKHIHHYDEQEFLVNCGRAATATEIACYASHLALWQQCATGKDPYLILEDDAELDASFLEGLLVVASQIEERGLIRVSLPEGENSRVTDELGQFEIQYCRSAALLPLAYAVSPKAAARLALAGRIVEEPVDKYMQRFWRHGQPVYAVCPAIVHLAPVTKKPDIGERKRRHYGFSTSLRRTARMAQNRIARARFNLGYTYDFLRSN